MTVRTHDVVTSTLTYLGMAAGVLMLATAFLGMGCMAHMNHAKYVHASNFPLSVCVYNDVDVNMWRHLKEALQDWNEALNVVAFELEEKCTAAEATPDPNEELPRNDVAHVLVGQDRVPKGYRGWARVRAHYGAVLARLWIQGDLDEAKTRHVLRHELGHALGLGHGYSWPWQDVSVMEAGLKYVPDYVDKRTADEVREIWGLVK